MDELRHKTHTNKSCLGHQRSTWASGAQNRTGMRVLLGWEASRRNVWLQGRSLHLNSGNQNQLPQGLIPGHTVTGGPQLAWVVNSEHKQITETSPGSLENLGSRLRQGYDRSQRFGEDDFLVTIYNCVFVRSVPGQPKYILFAAPSAWCRASCMWGHALQQQGGVRGGHR